MGSYRSTVSTWYFRPRDAVIKDPFTVSVRARQPSACPAMFVSPRKILSGHHIFYDIAFCDSESFLGKSPSA
jgi:hypothetical protein